MTSEQAGDVIQKIIEIKTSEDRSVKDLKTEMNNLRDALLNVEEGTESYQKGVERLQADQRDLNKVMSLTKSNAEAVKGSYYDLNNQLVEARKQWKGLTEEQRIADKAMGVDGLFGTINRLDKQLKELDHSIGQNQRNVGDYTESFKAAFEGAELSSTALGKGIKNVDAATKLMSKNPIIGVLTLLLPIITKIVGAVKENTTAVDALNKMMTAMQPIMDIATKVINKLAEAFAWLADKISNIVNKLFKKGEADSLPTAIEETADTTEVATQTNHRYAESLDKVDESARRVAEGIKQVQDVLAKNDKFFDDRRAYASEVAKEIEQDIKDTSAGIDAIFQNDIDGILAVMDAEKKRADEAKAQEQAIADAKKATAWAVVDATSSMLTSMSDMFGESKALAIASSTIDTISGAIKAYMACQSLPTPWGQIQGAINAAAVTASGLANIAKIRSASATSTGNPSFSAASVSAPSIQMSAPTPTRNITGVQEEQRINANQQPVQAYVVYSQLEGARGHIDTQTQESSF